MQASHMTRHSMDRVWRSFTRNATIMGSAGANMGELVWLQRVCSGNRKAGHLCKFQRVRYAVRLQVKDITLSGNRV